MKELIDINCNKCNSHIAIATDAEEGDIQTITFICSCGNKMRQDFVGYPFLGATETHFYDFITETEFQCHKK